MGSEEEAKHVTVLVTGFEAFQVKYPVNPSFEIAKALAEEFSAATNKAQHIRVLLHEPAVKVVYDHVAELIPRLLSVQAKSIDLVLHLGMASGRQFYTIEKYAHRDGYVRHRDLIGRALRDENNEFADCPAKMTSSLDYQRLLEDWHTYALGLSSDDLPIKGNDLRQSEDAGRYLCDFIYLNSLAFYGRRNEALIDGKTTDRPVMFLHVPGESDETTLKRGIKVATALVLAMADQILNT